MTSNKEHAISSASLNSSNGKLYLALKFSWDFNESLEIPKISVLSFWKVL